MAPMYSLPPTRNYFAGWRSRAIQKPNVLAHHECGNVFQTCVLWPPDSWPACLAERLPVEALVKQRAPGVELDLLRQDLSVGAPGPLRAESQRR